ncbi:hypothetical protein MRB53_041425 [Persea americana]|nr:hypothetical protein MRB53_041425 [Persea americana]
MSSNNYSRPEPGAPRAQSGQRRSGRRQSSTGQHRERRTSYSETRSPRSPEAARAPGIDTGYRQRRRSSNHHQQPPPSAMIRSPTEKSDGYGETVVSPINTSELDPMADASRGAIPRGRAEDLSRKKSLVRPERRRQNPDDPNYYYRQHAHKMNVMPSSTGVDPQIEDDLATQSSGSADLKRVASDPVLQPLTDEKKLLSKKPSAKKLQSNKLTRQATDFGDGAKRRRKQIEETNGALTPWSAYCHVITFWMPNAILRCMGKSNKEQQRAWREKIGLISIILLICTFVGYLTFGFTQTVCAQGGPVRLQANHVDGIYMIFHGEAYDLSQSKHPLARGIGSGANVLYLDPDHQWAGYDGSFLFQNVNGKCKGLINLAPGSDVPTDKSGNLAWYMPCNPHKQDGSDNDNPNKTMPWYLGYSCHTSLQARNDFYGLRSSGDVYYTWEDVRNKSRNLMIYSGDVLDLDLLKWFNTSQVSVPASFDAIRTDPNVRGKDMTLAFSGSNADKQMVQCFQEIIKVGSIDTETIGCIASKVVLYVSLIFILSIVVVKFVLALLFQWFLCRKYAASRTSMTSNTKKRAQQIEDWTDDIYAPPPKFADLPSNASSGNRRSSFFPTTSRFTSPYAIERSLNKNRPAPQTMASQSSTTRLLGGGMANRSETNLPPYSDVRQSTYNEDRSSMMRSDRYSSMPSEEVSGPQGFIHEAVVPQPPPEWKPFGFPLAHTMCLVTAYSEGPEGIRTTLDSIAMTDYPNSHKLMFIVCDGLIKGKGESLSTPEACLSMMKDHAVLPDEVQAFSYVAVASGAKRHNMAKIYSGFYDYGADSIIPVEKQQRVPMIIVVKTGTPAEQGLSKPGNRGKRDSQIILMSFLQKVMFDEFDERMTELEYEMFNGIWNITGISPDFYEIVLMVMLIRRIKTPKGGQNYWVPILANPDIVEHYSENVVDTLHKKNLLLLGEDRYLSTLMLKTFPKRSRSSFLKLFAKPLFPDKFKVLLSQRRRWINSTVHNLMELVLVRDLCGTFCFSMQFVVFIELVGTLVLPAAIAFTIYVFWNFILPVYAYWHFDDFSWGDTRQAAGANAKADRAGHGGDGEFDSSKITMKRWNDFEQERRLRAPAWSARDTRGPYSSNDTHTMSSNGYDNGYSGTIRGHVRQPSNLGHETTYTDYPERIKLYGIWDIYVMAK